MGRLASRFGVALLLAVACLSVAPTFAATAEVKDVTVQGGIQEGKARLVIEAQLNGLSALKHPFSFPPDWNSGSASQPLVSPKHSEPRWKSFRAIRES